MTQTLAIPITSPHVANNIYAKLRASHLSRIPANQLGTRTIALALRSGTVRVLANDAKTLLAELEDLDKRDGYEDQNIEAKNINIDYPPELPIQRLQSSSLYQQNLAQVETLSDANKLIRNFTTIFGMTSYQYTTPTTEALQEAALIATENGWTPTRFKTVQRQCLADGLACYFGTHVPEPGYLVESTISWSRDAGPVPSMEASAALCLGCDYATATSMDQWKHVVRHEAVHGWASAIAKKYDTDSAYDALKKWATRNRSVPQDFFETVDASLGSQRHDEISYFFEEGFDVAVMKLYAPKSVIREHKIKLAERLDVILITPTTRQEADTLIASYYPEPTTRLVTLARWIHTAKSLGLDEGPRAEAAFKKFYPEQIKIFDKYLQVFAWIDEFFTSELQWISSRNPNVLGKIK